MLSHPDRRVLAGTIALTAIGLLIGGAFLGLAVEGFADPAGAVGAFDAYMLRVARFTLLQALLSTLLSVMPALFVARALSRRPAFAGRRLLLPLLAVPLGLPAIVAAMGVLALLGRGGYFAGFLSWASGAHWSGIYGLCGILVAHVFFNLPLASRLFLQALETVPDDQWRLASQLGIRGRYAFRLVEWPVLRAALPGVAGLVFMLCVTSFAVVLMLGGGPAATTLEVAIYQALRFDFDPARAAALTILQIGLTVAVAIALARIGSDMTGETNLSVARRRPVEGGFASKVLDMAVIGAAAIFVAAPIGAMLVAGLDADLARLATEKSVLRATATSLGLAALAAVLAVAAALSLTAARRALELRLRGRGSSFLEIMTGTGAGFVLVVPPIVIGAGWFILLRHTGNVFAFAPVMVIAVNAAMAMPFALRAIRPAYDAASARHERLAASLGIAGWNRLRLIDMPVLARPMATGFAFAMALSLGDLGVIALFGSDAVQTLPHLLHARMGAYRTADAAGIALLLALLCLALVLVAERLGRGRHA